MHVHVHVHVQPPACLLVVQLVAAADDGAAKPNVLHHILCRFRLLPLLLPRSRLCRTVAAALVLLPPRLLAQRPNDAHLQGLGRGGGEV